MKTSEEEMKDKELEQLKKKSKMEEEFKEEEEQK